MPTPQNGQHTQAIRRQKPANYLSVLDHFVELALKGLSIKQSPGRNLRNDCSEKFRETPRTICDTSRSLLLFAQFKKREK